MNATTNITIASDSGAGGSTCTGITTTPKALGPTKRCSRVKLIAPQTFTPSGAANTQPVLFAVIGGILNDYIATDGSRDQWVWTDNVKNILVQSASGTQTLEYRVE